MYIKCLIDTASENKCIWRLALERKKILNEVMQIRT